MQPTQTGSVPQPSKYVYVPSNQAGTALTGSVGPGLPDIQQQQGDDVWKNEGDGDSGVEDEPGTESLQHKAEGSSLTVTAFSKKPVLKSVRYVARQGETAKLRPVAGEKKVAGEPGAAGRKKGQLVVKKSIWDRLGSKVGETRVRKVSVFKRM